MQKTKTKNTRRNYAKYYSKLKHFHKFSFSVRATPTKEQKKIAARDVGVRNIIKYGNVSNERKNELINEKAREIAINEKLTPAQKAIISKLWFGYGSEEKGNRVHGYKNAIRKVEEGNAQFLNVHKKSELRKLNKMKHTNKGVFVFEKNVKPEIRRSTITEYRIDKLGRTYRVKHKQIGIQLKPAITRPLKAHEKIQRVPMRREEFFPFPKPELIPSFMESLFAELKPNSWAIGVMSARGSVPHTTMSQFTYIEDAILEYQKAAKKHPFSGVYFYWY